VGQGAVFRMEKQSDFLLSKLREYVGAPGVLNQRSLKVCDGRMYCDSWPRSVLFRWQWPDLIASYRG